MRKFFSLIIFFCLLNFGALAQPGDPNDGDPPGGQVPISGIEWLLLSGAALGARNLYKNYKKR